jgi:hypothetical protein
MTLRRNRRRRSRRKPAAIAAGGLSTAAVVAMLRKRRRAREAELEPLYGPPNEGVPSHETLAPSKEAAGKTG